MYETEDQGDGYKSLKLYLQKVNPKCTAFFQYPKKNNMALDAVWYEARPATFLTDSIHILSFPPVKRAP